MLRAGIIGCGKIADQHAEEIKQINGCRLVAVCDSELLMARQLAERFQVMDCFSSIDEFLAKARPDVVHITTPPQTHLALGMKCLDAGCHLYIEKPFGVNASEAQQLITAATEKNLKITAGHNAQFTHAALRMRELVRQGFLGGPPVHMESYYCYNLENATYARAVLGDKNHWVRKLPGALLHNIISHGISKIAEFLTSDSFTVQVHGFSSRVLTGIGETDIVDEVRVIIHDDNNCTAYFTFSSQIRPVLHQLRLYGPKNSLIIDDDHQTVVLISGKHYKSYLNQFIPPYDLAKQYAANSLANIKKFIQRDFPMNYGMQYLIRSFYRAISEGAPLPVPCREILLTSRIMDAIFQQIHQKLSDRYKRANDDGDRGERVSVHFNTGI